MIQTIPTGGVLIGDASNIANPANLGSVEWPAFSGDFYPRGVALTFNSQTGSWNVSGGAGSIEKWGLVGVTSVSWEFSRVEGTDTNSGAGVHITSPFDYELNPTSSVVTWQTSGGADQHVWNQGSTEIREVRTVGYATRAETSDGALDGDGEGLTFADGVQTVGFTVAPPIPIEAIPMQFYAFGAVFAGGTKPFIALGQVTIDYERVRLIERIPGPRLGLVMRR